MTHNVEWTVTDVRTWFANLLTKENFVVDKTGCKMIEVIGATFVANDTSIFGKVNENYVKREIEWYKSQSLSVHDIPGEVPKAWLACASKKGLINSNYGFLIWSEENGRQYEKTLFELKGNPFSRRAVMIYTRPSIWNEFNADGMSDFICTNTVQYMIRKNQTGVDELSAVVQMRSNDAIFGYKNDKFWQDYVHKQLAQDLDVAVGPMIWHAGSLHVYERHFDLVKNWIDTTYHGVSTEK